jgi:hypothetical protein
MELGEALERIEVIRAHVARTAVFRGYRAATVAFTGGLALVVAALQALLVPEPLVNAHFYLQLWIGTAAVSVLMVGAELSLRYLRTPSRLEREQTLQAVEQFVPCLVAGAGLTWGIVQFWPGAVGLLPGMWAIVFSLGIFASCRHLPGLSVLVGLYYLASGAACLAFAREQNALSPWAMAGTFGVGQLFTAAVLYFTLERTDARP